MFPVMATIVMASLSSSDSCCDCCWRQCFAVCSVGHVAMVVVVVVGVGGYFVVVW